MRGAYRHNWERYWSSSLFGAVAGLSYNATGKALWCGSYIIATNNGGAGLTNCDPGFTMAEIGVSTRWTPVKNLTFSSEVMYAQLDTNMKGSVSGTTNSTYPLSTGVYQFKNMGTVEVEFRAQRNF